tara:strand:+ start:328 stop:486 length:159 start_codon:yes stop_codon:yes gene_type:complete
MKLNITDVKNSWARSIGYDDFNFVEYWFEGANTEALDSLLKFATEYLKKELK